MVESLPGLLVGLVIMLGLNAYALLAGADFGGGVWDLFASGPRREAQRRLIADAMGPVWEANHVWLILVVVLLFTCFPPVFARLAIALHIPLTLMLIGIVLRGSAFIFRNYEDRNDMIQRRWGRVFAVASLITPLLLGVMIGAVASGRIVPPVGTDSDFPTLFLRPWLTPFALGVGAFALCLFGFLAAVYLTVEARGNRDLEEDFRQRALGAGVAVFLTAAGVLALSFRQAGAPLVWHGLMHAERAWIVQTLTAIASIAAFAALLLRRYRLARVAAGAQVSLILWGWGVSQYPYLLPPDLTIDQAAAPDVTLRLVLLALAGGGMILIPALAYLFRLFKVEARPEKADGM
jgi:cytochrome d ubiquinol oxidase subunit II